MLVFHHYIYFKPVFWSQILFLIDLFDKTFFKDFLRLNKMSKGIFTNVKQWAFIDYYFFLVC